MKSCQVARPSSRSLLCNPSSENRNKGPGGLKQFSGLSLFSTRLVLDIVGNVATD